MPNNHPYDKKSDRRQQDLNDLVGGAVNFGLGISSTVLSGIAGALDSVGDSLNRAAQRPEQNSFIAYRRKLDNSLAGHYGGWMTMGVLGWVFGGCFAMLRWLWPSLPVWHPMMQACGAQCRCSIFWLRRLPPARWDFLSWGTQAATQQTILAVCAATCAACTALRRSCRS